MIYALLFFGFGFFVALLTTPWAIRLGARGKELCSIDTVVDVHNTPGTVQPFAIGAAIGQHQQGQQQHKIATRKIGVTKAASHTTAKSRRTRRGPQP